MSKAIAISPSQKSEDDFQAEEDARTMQRMGEIMSDPKRHGRAKKQMEKIMADMKKTEMAMTKMIGEKEDESMGGMMKKHQKGMTA